MTNSGGRNLFKITPKRSQFEDLSPQAERPTLPGTPAQPNKERYQTGGQLFDQSSFQKDNKLGAAVDAIEAFIDPNTGGWTKSQSILGDSWRADSQVIASQLARADSWLESADAALQNSEKNAQITKLLTKKKQIELARENRLNDNTTAFFYWDQVAFDAGRNAAITLKDNAEKDLLYIASLPETERGLYIQQLASGTLKGTEHIPSAARAARIDPIMALISTEIKASANSKARDFKDDQERNVMMQKIRGPLNEASALIFANGQSKEVIADIRKAFIDPRNFLMNNKGRTGPYATNELSLAIQNGLLLGDANNDGWDDIGQPGVGIDASLILKALDGFMVDDGAGGKIAILEAKDVEGKTIKERILKAQSEATSYYTQMVKAKETVRNGFLRDFKASVYKESNNWFELNPQATQEQIVAERLKAEANIDKLLLTNGLKDILSPKDKKKLLDEAYPIDLLETPVGLKNDILDAAQDLINNEILEIPESLMLRMRVGEDPNGKFYDVYSDVRKLFRDARKTTATATRSRLKELVRTDVTGITDQLGTILTESNTSIADMYKGNTDARSRAKTLIDGTVAKVKPLVITRATFLLNQKYRDALAKGLDINDPNLQNQIRTSVLNDIKNEPLLTDIDSYVENKGKNNWGWRDFPVPGSVTLNYPSGTFVPGQVNTPFTPNKSTVKYNDNGMSLALQLQSNFSGNNARSNFDKYTRKTVLLPEAHLKNWYHALSLISQGKTIPEDLITADMRETLHNLSVIGTDDNVKPWELLKRSSEAFYGNTEALKMGLTDEDYLSAWQQLGSLTNSVSFSNKAENSVDVTSVSVKPMTRLIYGVNNNGVEVSITKGNDQQFSNGVPAPLNGTVVSMGNNDMNGNYIVIRANSATPYNKKGDLIRISNLANIRDDIEVGDVLDKAEQIGISGDDSDLNSTIGSSTTGQIVSPGGITVQIFQNQTGELTEPDSNAQYSQPYNTAFVKAMFSEIYTGTEAAAVEPVEPINRGLGYSPNDIDVGGRQTIILPTTASGRELWRNPDGTWKLEGAPKSRNKLMNIASQYAMSTVIDQQAMTGWNAKRTGPFKGWFTTMNSQSRDLYFQLKAQYFGELLELERTRPKPTEAELKEARNERILNSNFAKKWSNPKEGSGYTTYPMKLEWKE